MEFGQVLAYMSHDVISISGEAGVATSGTAPSLEILQVQSFHILSLTATDFEHVNLHSVFCTSADSA